MSTYYAKIKGTAFCDINRNEIGSDNANVTKWHPSAPFIYCVAIGQDSRNPVAGVFKLQWRIKGGSFADLDSTGVIKYSTATVLTDAGALTSGNAKVAVSNMTWQNGEESEDGVTASIDLGDDCYSELQFGCDCSEAQHGAIYEFQLYNNTLGAAVAIETGGMLTLQMRRVFITHQ